MVFKMHNTRKNLLLFFDRPTEPIFMEKGDNKTRFKIPENYYPTEYKNLMNRPSSPEVASTAQATFTIAPPTLALEKSSPSNEEKIKDSLGNFLSSTRDLPATLSLSRDDEIFKTTDPTDVDVGEFPLPDLSLPMQLARDELFSFFVPNHRQMAGKLIDIFMSMPNLEKLQSIFAYCQLNINPFMFNYCLSVTILHRPDTRGMNIPTFAETFPDKFVDRKSLRRAREYCALVPEGTTLPLIKIELPVNPKAVEQRLAYFREDIGLNSHHWHWHLIYPTESTNNIIVKKDRRGELFYYMHHQVMARYNVERMCNGLERTKPYDNFREPIAEGYFPLLDSANASRAWAPRFDNVSVYDINRSGIKATIADMDTWRERILAAIESQSIMQLDGSQLPLDEETGIDILGNLVEATSISYNRDYYGDYHNKGHLLFSYVHDPDEKHAQQHTVMGDAATAMRDPLFYRWHSNIDNIFTLYKDKLTPYGPDKLVFPNVCISSIRVESVGEENTIITLWERSIVSLKNGLDFAPRRDVFAQFTHLQHEEFRYVIEVSNTSGKKQIGTVRIFMAPTVDHDGRTLSFEEQRKLMIEMDKFSLSLSPGMNTIHRSSLDSSVTIPFERIFRDHSGKSGTSATSGFNFCDCGWPQYLLVPKGTTEGYPMAVFVMVSNWKEDKVERDLTGADNDNASYCGLRDQKYPDRRSMGFPFDRKPAAGIDSLGKFLQPNMAYNKCIIKFTDRIRERGQHVNQPEDKTHDNVHECERTRTMMQGPCQQSTHLGHRRRRRCVLI